jgi:hypothetical protein
MEHVLYSKYSKYSKYSMYSMYSMYSQYRQYSEYGTVQYVFTSPLERVGESTTRNAAETACVTLTGQASSKGFSVEMPMNLVYYAEGTYAHATKAHSFKRFF